MKLSESSNSNETEATSPEISHARRRVIRIEPSPVTIIILALLIFGVWMLNKLLPVILVLSAALVIAGTISPIVRWIEDRHIRRSLGIWIVFTGLVVITVLLITVTIPTLFAQATDLLDQEPAVRMRVANWLAGSHLTRSLAEMLRSLPSGYLVKVAAADAIVFSTRVITVLAYMLSAVFLALYIMIDRDRLRGGLFLMVPRSHHLLLSRIMLKLETIVGGYMLGQLITSVLMALFVFFLLTVCGIPNALAIAVFAGIADVLPYIGALLALVAAVAASSSGGPVIIAVVLALMLCYKVLENQVIVPAVYGRALRLPSSVILFSLLSGTVLLGIPGTLLALPVAAVVAMLIEELRVDLPGQQEQPKDVEIKVRDDQGKAEYERRAEGMPAEQAAAIAVEMSSDRRDDEKKHPLKTDAHQEDKVT